VPRVDLIQDDAPTQGPAHRDSHADVRHEPLSRRQPVAWRIPESCADCNVAVVGDLGAVGCRMHPGGQDPEHAEVATRFGQKPTDNRITGEGAGQYGGDGLSVFRRRRTNNHHDSA
jgi:hypothetical protein